MGTDDTSFSGTGAPAPEPATVEPSLPDAPPAAPDVPAPDEPAHDEPVQDEPVQDEPVHDEPGHDEPGHDEAVHDEPVQDALPAATSDPAAPPFAPAPVVVPPIAVAPAYEPPAAAPITAPSSAGGRSRLGRWVGIALCVIAVGVAAAAVVAYGQATDDRRSAERELVRVERDLADEAARADAAEADAETERGRADDAEASLDQLGDDVADRDEQIAQRDEELDGYRDETAGFLALTIEVGFGTSASDARCMADAYVVDRGSGALGDITDSFNGVGDLDTDLFDYAEGCGVDPDSLVPAGPEVEEGFTYGDNPTLDSLWDACEAGVGVACDELFFTSEADSEYESFGVTCGNRFDFADLPDNCADAI